MSCIAAVDPGRDKSGFAVVAPDGNAVFQRILPTHAFIEEMKPFMERYVPVYIVIGNGTTSASMRKRLQSAWPEMQVLVIDEYRTTEEARREYWKVHPPSGWRRLLPLTMQVPPVPVDDFAAVLLARRYLEQHPLTQGNTEEEMK